MGMSQKDRQKSKLQKPIPPSDPILLSYKPNAVRVGLAVAVVGAARLR